MFSALLLATGCACLLACLLQFSLIYLWHQFCFLCESKWMIFILYFSRSRHLFYSLQWRWRCVCLFALETTLHDATKRKAYLCLCFFLSLCLSRESLYRFFSPCSAPSSSAAFVLAAASFRKETLYELYITFCHALLCFSIRCAHRQKRTRDGNLTVFQLMVFNFLPPHHQRALLPISFVYSVVKLKDGWLVLVLLICY